MDVTLTCAGPDGRQDQRSLREWLPNAAPSVRLLPAAPDQDGGDHLGLSVDDVCAVISGTADLTTLLLAVRGWARNRFGHRVAGQEPVHSTRGEVTVIELDTVVVTVTRAPGEEAPTVTLDER